MTWPLEYTEFEKKQQHHNNSLLKYIGGSYVTLQHNEMI